MTARGKIKKVFSGGNTAKGFYSYYDNLLGSEATRLYILKGGPGGGKSSFIRRISNVMLEKGYDLEHHQCTSDSQSVDAVVIPQLGIGIVDGTAPHTLDPKTPGAVDEIVNLGQFWDKEALIKIKDEIKDISSRNSKIYKRVYKYLLSAKLVRDNMESIYKDAMNMGKLNLVIEELKEELFSKYPYSTNLPKARHLFDMAYTADGIIDHLETITDTVDNIIYINSDSIDLTTLLLDEIANESLKKGFFVEIYHEPLVETNINTILIPELNIVLTSNKKYEYKDNKIVDINSFMNMDLLNENTSKLNEDKEVFTMLINKAIENLLDAKVEHDKMEKSYVENIDFTGIDEIRDKVLDEILGYTK